MTFVFCWFLNFIFLTFFLKFSPFGGKIGVTGRVTCLRIKQLLLLHIVTVAVIQYVNLKPSTHSISSCSFLVHICCSHLAFKYAIYLFKRPFYSLQPREVVWSWKYRTRLCLRHLPETSGTTHAFLCLSCKMMLRLSPSIKIRDKQMPSLLTIGLLHYLLQNHIHYGCVTLTSSCYI